MNSRDGVIMCTLFRPVTIAATLDLTTQYNTIHEK